jgi:ubiquinone/menaquinone biosynthesis C-methylase UbiE
MHPVIIGLASLGAVGHVSFDRAASYYDATRGLPDEAKRSLAEILSRELAQRGRCLEIGVGTGRIALPLRHLGIDLTGTDISAGMLDRLRENGRDGEILPVLLADAVDLPFAGSSFGAVLSSHVLHLIASWKAVVDEAVRVLDPKGVLLVDFGGGAPAPWSRWSAEILEAHGVPRIRPGVSTPGPIADHLGTRSTLRPLAVYMTARRSLQQDLDEWQAQIHSWTWPYRPDEMEVACEAVRAHAVSEGRSLSEEVDLHWTIQWWAFDLAGDSIGS